MHPIFFDLDHTLWDFETNSKNTLSELLEQFKNHFSVPIPIETFFPVYALKNEECWVSYRKNEITQAELRIKRFKDTFDYFHVPYQSWQQDFASHYTTECPRKGALIPGALQTIRTLSDHYQIYIITNGFEDIQQVKLQCSTLGEYVSGMITSESTGFRKPDIRIFQHAIKTTGSRNLVHWYIGDDYETDVLGGHAAGMNPIFFNPHQKANPDEFPEISYLPDLLSILEV